MNSDTNTTRLQVSTTTETPIHNNQATRTQEDDSSIQKTTQMTGGIGDPASYAEAAAKDPTQATNRSVQERIPPDISGLKGSSQPDLLYRRVYYTKLNSSTRKEVAAAEDKQWKQRGRTINLVDAEKEDTSVQEEKEEDDDVTIVAQNSAEKLISVRCFLFMHLKKDFGIDEQSEEGRNLWMSEELNKLLAVLKAKFQTVKLAPWQCQDLFSLPETEYADRVDGKAAFFNRYFYDYNPFCSIGQSQNMRVNLCVPWDTDMKQFNDVLGFWREAKKRRINLAPSNCIHPVTAGGFMRSYPEMVTSDAFKQVFMERFNLREVGFVWDHKYLWKERHNSRCFMQMEIEYKDRGKIQAMLKAFKGKVPFLGSRMFLLEVNDLRENLQQKERLKDYLVKAQEVSILGTTSFQKEGIRLHKLLQGNGTLLNHLLHLKPKRSYLINKEGQKKLITAPIFEAITPGDNGTIASYRAYKTVQAEADSIIQGLPKYLEALGHDASKYCSKAHISECALGKWKHNTHEFTSAETLADQEFFNETALLAGIQISEETAVTNQQSGTSDAGHSVASTLSSLTEKTTESKRVLCRKLQAEKVQDKGIIEGQRKSMATKDDTITGLLAQLEAAGMRPNIPNLPAIAQEKESVPTSTDPPTPINAPVLVQNLDIQTVEENQPAESVAQQGTMMHRNNLDSMAEEATEEVVEGGDDSHIDPTTGSPFRKSVQLKPSLQQQEQREHHSPTVPTPTIRRSTRYKGSARPDGASTIK